MRGEDTRGPNSVKLRKSDAKNGSISRLGRLAGVLRVAGAALLAAAVVDAVDAVALAVALVGLGVAEGAARSGHELAAAVTAHRHHAFGWVGAGVDVALPANAL